MKATGRKALSHIGEDDTVAITTNLCHFRCEQWNSSLLIFVKCSVGGPRLGEPFLHGVTQGLAPWCGHSTTLRARTSLPRHGGGRLGRAQRN